MSSKKSDDPKTVQEKLCGMLLEFAGKSPDRLAQAQKETRILEDAIQYMSKPQADEARRRIGVMETKWGPVLNFAGEVNCTKNEIAPEKRIALWLTARRNPERILKILHRAGNAIREGVKGQREIMDRAYAGEVDNLVCMVTYSSFRDWLVCNRIGVPKQRPAGQGVRVEWEPGNDIERWTKEFHTLQGAVLEELVSLREKRRAEVVANRRAADKRRQQKKSQIA